MIQHVDPYRVLQVDPEAEPEVIRAAYRSLAQKYHPDKTGGQYERMTAINEAWAILRDPARRAEHDRRRAEAAAAAAAAATSFMAQYSARETPPAPSAAAEPSPAKPRYARAATSTRTAAAGPVLDFGRYAGWSLGDLALHDPDYLEWLVRTPIGHRFRADVDALIHPVGDAPPAPARTRGRRGRAA